MFNSVCYSKEAQIYYDSKYASTPINTDDKVAHRIKKGENLWSIAKDQLADENASNVEILEMMYKIAKLNNKDSIESANNIKANDIIYLPQTNAQSGYTSTIKTYKDAVENACNVSQKVNDIIVLKGEATYNQKALYRLENLKNIPQSLYKEHGEAGVIYWDKTLNDKDNKFIISKSTSYSPVIYTGLSVIKKEGNNPYGKTEAHMYISIDKKSKVKDVCFEVPGVNINETGFDYKIDTQGNLYRHIGLFNRYQKIGELPPQQYENLITQAQEYFDENVK